MGSLNKVLLIGNLGADPEMKYLPSGDAVVNLSLATTDRWKDKQTGENKERTEWHRVSFFGKAAETIAEYMTKGSAMYIEGSIQTRKYEKDGVTHYATDIKGRSFQFLGRKGDNEQAPRQDEAAAPKPAPAPQAGEDDDIPF